MIFVTRFNGKRVFINPDLIQFVEDTPDTVITLVDKSKIVVKEPVEVVVERFIAFRQQVMGTTFVDRRSEMRNTKPESGG